MFCPLLVATLMVGTVLSTRAASFQHRVAQSPGTVLGPDNTPLPATVVLTRRWERDLCYATLENRGTQAVNVGSVVLAEFAHGLAPETPVYGEGFTKLSQTGGTLAQPVDEGFYTDRQHYRIPEAQGRRTVYGVLTLRPAPDRVALLGFTGARRFAGRFAFDPNTLSISCDGEGLALPAGGTWELEPLLVVEGADRNALFDRLADELLFHATLVYATGGMLLAGDDLRTYGDREKQRLGILYPPTGQAMRFASETFEVGRLRLPDAEMVAVLNWHEVPRDFVLPIAVRARVTELWSGQNLGVREGTLTLPAVPPHSGRLLRLVPAGEDRN